MSLRIQYSHFFAGHASLEYLYVFTCVWSSITRKEYFRSFARIPTLFPLCVFSRACKHTCTRSHLQKKVHFFAPITRVFQANKFFFSGANKWKEGQAYLHDFFDVNYGHKIP